MAFNFGALFDANAQAAISNAAGYLDPKLGNKLGGVFSKINSMAPAQPQPPPVVAQVEASKRNTTLIIAGAGAAVLLLVLLVSMRR
jgi:hypothetical protein